MYASFHSSVGIAIMLLPLPVETRIALAVLSHPIVDSLGEAGLSGDWIKKEVTCHIVLILAALVSGFSFYAVLGILAANFIDVLDKIVFTRFLGHEIIHTNKYYPPLIIQFTEKQTFALNWIAVVIASVLMLWSWV